MSIKVADDLGLEIQIAQKSSQASCDGRERERERVRRKFKELRLKLEGECKLNLQETSIIYKKNQSLKITEHSEQSEVNVFVFISLRNTNEDNWSC